MNKRLNYYGGDQQHRMIRDKLRTLKKAQLYSYQAATAILSDLRQFKCLINPDKTKPAYDNKILSIPYKEKCLNGTTDAEVTVGIKPGDVFTWKETSTHWLVYLEAIEEDAYFRSEIRRCDQEVSINDQSYWVYLRGPVQTAIEWKEKKKYIWNDLNYSLVMYITADENTNAFFERFKTIKITDPRINKKRTWQVAGVDPYYGDGILQIFLDEYYDNSIEEQREKEKETEEKPIDEVAEGTPAIKGPTTVSQYSKAYYEIQNIQGGHWFIKWKGKQIDLNKQLRILPLNINVEDLGKFTLIYRTENKDVTLDVEVVSL